MEETTLSLQHAQGRKDPKSGLPGRLALNHARNITWSVTGGRLLVLPSCYLIPP